MRRRFHLVLLTGLLATACGSDSMTSPSASVPPATIQGTVNGSTTGSSGFSASSVSAAAVKAGIRITVMGTGLSTTTDASGRFTLTGITSDHVTLHFEGPGIDATLEIGGLVLGQTLTIKVKVSGNQAGFDDDNESPAPVASKCFTAGEKAEVEGTITAKSNAGLTVFQQGKGDYLCKVTAATPIRHGNQKLALADLKIGDRVHVSGQGMGSSGGACVVAADEVKLQN